MTKKKRKKTHVTKIKNGEETLLISPGEIKRIIRKYMKITYQQIK